jgi:uncharacterized protein
MIRGLGPGDADWVIELNAAHETETSPLDEERFQYMLTQSLVGWAHGDDDAFMLVFDQDSKYDSPNFLWFKECYPSFAYIDRIVVDHRARGRGIARAMYAQLFVEVFESRFDKIVCEVNFAPPNPASDALHASLGFQEVGHATLANGKTVRYLKRDLP